MRHSMLKRLIFLCLVLASIWAPYAHAAITRVEVVTGTPATHMNLGTSTTVGELVVVFACEGHGGSTQGAVSDSGGQTYTQIWTTAVNAIETGWTCSLWYLQNSASSVTWVNVSLGTSQTATYSASWVAHYKGVATTGSLDRSAAITGTALSSPWASTSVTTTSANEVLIGSSFFYTGGTLASSGSWSTLVTTTNGNGDKLGFADQIVSSTAAYQLTGTSSKSLSFPGIATFKGATTAINPPHAGVM
jgi:hypothetical protein